MTDELIKYIGNARFLLIIQQKLLCFFGLQDCLRFFLYTCKLFSVKKAKGLSEDQLYISKITADQGPVWKRFRAASFGRAAGIRKKTTHLVIELDLITK